MAGIFELPRGTMKRTNRRRTHLALLALVSCEAAAPQDPCRRLGGLCSDRDEVVRLGLEDSRNATADLDGDGALDLVTAAPGGSLSIAWGGFGRREYRLVNGGVADVEIGDVDGDGDQDVVYVTIEPAMLKVLDNIGGRALPEGLSMAVEGRPQSLWVGALDGDGSADAVVASLDGLTVFMQGLKQSQHLAFGVGIVEVQVGDLNGDGRGDLVAVDRDDGALWVVQAQGDGFAAPRRIATGPDPRYLELYDLDGDGSLDALTHGDTKPEIWLHTGDGAGGFSAPHGLVVQDTPSKGFGAYRDPEGGRWLVTVAEPRVIAHHIDAEDRVVGRVFGTSYADALGLDMDAGSLVSHGPEESYRYTLEPAFVFSERWNGPGGSLQPIVLGDFDVDGMLDLAAVEDYYSVVIRRQIQGGQWVEQSAFDVPTYVMSMVAADVTGDGLPDLVLGDESSSIRVAVGRGDGRFELGPGTPIEFQPWIMYGPIGSPGDGGAAVAVADDSSDIGVMVLRFDAAGLVKETAQPIASGVRPRIASDDVDGDGVYDLIAFFADAPGPSLVIVPGSPDGWGAAQSRLLSPLPPDTMLQEASLAVGDIDLDGTLDAVIVGFKDMVRLRDIGAAMPPPPEHLEVREIYGGELSAILEIDGDGKPDLVLCYSSELRVVLGIADAEPELQAPLDIFISNCALHVDPEEPRVTAATFTGRGLSVLTPALAPGLERTDVYHGGPGPSRRLATGDINADGDLDVVIGDAGQAGGGLTALWGADDGLSGRGERFVDGALVRAEFVVVPFDDRPGDEVVSAWSNGFVEVWSYVDGSLLSVFTGRTGSNNAAAVGVQRRAAEGSDVVVLAGGAPETWQVDALSPGDDGEFIYEPVLLWTGPRGHTPPGITVADFDGDGYGDLAVHPGRGRPVELRWGNRERMPITGSITVDPDSIYRIASADMDGDGAPELVLGTSMGALSIGFDGRAPRAPVSLTTDVFDAALVIADMEGDGLPDLLRADYNGLVVVLRALAGDTRGWLPFHFNPWSVVQTAALDDDGILDLVGLRDGDVVMRRSGEGSR